MHVITISERETIHLKERGSYVREFGGWEENKCCHYFIISKMKQEERSTLTHFKDRHQLVAELGHQESH